MYDLLKSIAENNDWVFEYGREDFLNLNNNMEPNKIYLFVQPIEIDSRFSDVGIESQTFNVKLMLVIPSNLSETYQFRYENYIKPLLDDSKKLIIDGINCNNLDIQFLKTIEVINYFDFNADGLIINLSAK